MEERKKLKKSARYGHSENHGISVLRRSEDEGSTNI